MPHFWGALSHAGVGVKEMIILGEHQGKVILLILLEGLQELQSLDTKRKSGDTVMSACE